MLNKHKVILTRFYYKVITKSELYMKLEFSVELFTLNSDNVKALIRL